VVVNNPGWAIQSEPHTGVWLDPFDGWGFLETIDGELAPPFEVVINESGVDIGNGILGWRGRVMTSGHKYSGLPFEMHPRHTTWSGMVVINIRDGDEYAYSGLAESKGLKCSWL